MSGRGTIKAGTFGGRRYREKAVKTTKQNKELAKDIKASQKALAPKSKQIKDLPQKARLPRAGGVLNAPLGRGGLGLAPATFQDMEQEEIPFVGKKPFAAYTQSRDDRARDIQRTANTMPLMQDANYLNLIRREVEQRHREMNNPDIDFEDYNEQDDIEEEQAVEAGEVDEETGDVEYGTADPGIGNFGEVDALDFDPFADNDDIIDEQELGTDSDEEAEAFGRALDKAGEQKNLAEEIARRRKARQQSAMSIPGGDRVRPNRFYDPKIDFQAEDDSSSGIRTKTTDPTKQTQYIRGLAPQEKMPTKYPIEFYKRKKATKKEGGGTKLDIGAKGNLKPTDEYVALQEGRVLDTRLGMAGRDIETGTRSRVNLKTEKTKKKVIPLFDGQKLGIMRDPKTRKILTDRKGNPKLEKRNLVLAPREKPVEELWGIDRKGMSRDEDNPPTRDPYEGRRNVAKEPGKRATKRREADTKHALYVKTKREEDPNWQPRGHNEFQYGAGMPANTRRFSQIKQGKEAVLKNEGAGQYIPEPFQPDLTGNNAPIVGADRMRMDMVQNALVPAFPGATDIFAPKKSMRRGVSQAPMQNITNPPMAPMQQAGGTEPPMRPTGSWQPEPGTPAPYASQASDADIMRGFYAEMGEEPDEDYIASQVAMLA